MKMAKRPRVAGVGEGGKMNRQSPEDVGSVKIPCMMLSYIRLFPQNAQHEA